MEEELLKLLYNYKANNLLADKHFIEETLDIILKHSEHLNPYITKLSISNKPLLMISNTCATYSSEKKKVKFYLASISILLSTAKYYKLDNADTVDFVNLTVINFLLHECEHANQDYIMDNGESNIEKLTVSIGKYLFTLNDKIKYQEDAGLLSRELQNKYTELYNYCPTERLAQIKSDKKTINIINLDSKISKNIFLIYAFMYYRELLRGYEKEDNSPTIKFLKQISKYIHINRNEAYIDNEVIPFIDTYNNLPLEERLELGLRITPEEKNNIYGEKITLNKTIIKLTRSK